MPENQEPNVANEKDVPASAGDATGSQDPQTEHAQKIKALEEQKELLEKQTNLLTAQQAYQAAQEALLAAQKQDSDEIKALDAQKELLEKQKEVLTAQQAYQTAQQTLTTSQREAIEAAFPKGEAAAPEGTITQQDSGYLAELVAYQTLQETAQAIGREIDSLNLVPEPDHEIRILIVSGRNQAQGDLPLIQLDKQFLKFEEILQSQIDDNRVLLGAQEERVEGVELGGELEGFTGLEGLIPAMTPLGAALPIAAGLISSVADIVGYFKSDYAMTGKTVQLSYDALSATVAGQIQKHKAYIQDFGLIDDSTIVERFTHLIELKQELEGTTELIKSQFIPATNTSISTLTGEISTLQGEIKQLNADTDKDKIAEKQTSLVEKQELLDEKTDLLSAANSAITESENRIKVFGDYVTTITTAPDKETPSPVVQAALRQQIRVQEISHILHLSVLSAGGESITQKRLWRSGETAYIGGCAIQYVLATSAGHVVVGDTRVGVSHLYYNLGRPSGAWIQPISFGRVARQSQMQTP